MNDGTEEIKCIKCYQPDMPFLIFYVFKGYDRVFKIYHDPYFGYETIEISEELAEKEIKDFQEKMLGIGKE